MKVNVSIVMPVYNEERYIDRCINTLLQQDYPQDKMEWIFVDGMSDDRTVEIIDQYRQRFPQLIKILMNPNRTAPSAMNVGIAEAQAEYLIRLDAHAEYATDYISKCVYYLETTDAENVGGIAETKANGIIGECIAKMLSSRFGVGNSEFRTNGESGYVDTVPFGAFRRNVFERLGGFDERLPRSEDNEINYRIRKNGGKVFLANDIRFTYYCRNTLQGIVNMAWQNGKWNVITMKLCPGAMGVRHFIPLTFVLSLILLPLLILLHPVFCWLLALELVLYFALDSRYSINLGKNMKERAILFCLFPCFHIAYGFGSICGLFKLLGKDFR